MAFTAEFQAFRGTLGTGAVLCQRGDPEAKGLVERVNGYFRPCPGTLEWYPQYFGTTTMTAPSSVTTTTLLMRPPRRPSRRRARPPGTAEWYWQWYSQYYGR